MPDPRWKHCHRCGLATSKSEPRCSGCGTVLCCANCGSPAHPAFRHCPDCGAALTPESAPSFQGRSAPDWIADLVSHDGATRQRAAEAVSAMEAAAEPAVAALIAGLDASQRWRRIAPAESLLQIGREPERAAAVLVDAMGNDPSPDVRRTAMGGLMKTGHKARSAVPALLDLLREGAAADRPDVPALAAEALGWIADASSKVIDALRTAVDATDPALRRAARAALKRLKA